MSDWPNLNTISIHERSMILCASMGFSTRHSIVYILSSESITEGSEEDIASRS